MNDMTAIAKFMGVNVIEIPRKVWLPKVKNEFRPEPQYSDVDEGYFIFQEYGKAVFRSKPWRPGHRDDVITFDKELHNEDFQSLKINDNIPVEVKVLLLEICKQYWDCFASEGVSRTILSFEFSIDTGDHTPIWTKRNCSNNEALTHSTSQQMGKRNPRKRMGIPNCTGT